MSQHYLYLFITLLTFSCCFGTLFNLRSTQIDCTSGVNGFCSDCDHTVLCNGDIEVSESTCPTGQVCEQISKFASCVDSYNVEDCECPLTGSAILPDFYDDNKFIVCDNGDRHIQECQENEIFNADTNHCEAIPTTTVEPTTTPITRSPLCPEGLFDSVPVSCTEFQICYSDGTFSDIKTCPAGYIFIDEVNECYQYAPFTCSGKTEDGYYADTSNCSVYHLCIGEEIFGSSSICPDGELFDDPSGTCLPEEDSSCIAVPDCGICPDAETFIKVDCFNYYECEENTDESKDLEFVPVLYTCPTGTCFDESTTYCEIAPRLS